MSTTVQLDPAASTNAATSTNATAPVPSGSRPGGKGLAVAASLVINFAVPLVGYELLRRHGASSAEALALSGAVPVAWTLVQLAVRRRLDPLGVVSVVSFGLGVLISWASGGNTLALDLQDPALTGLAGIACLASVAIGRPLHPYILRLLGRSNPKYADIATRTKQRSSIVTTAVLGLALTGHAVAVAILALTQTPSTFVALENPVGLSFFGAGIAFLFIYRSRLQARQRVTAA